MDKPTKSVREHGAVYMHHVTAALALLAISVTQHATGTVCDLIYIELGSNRGDSLEAFVAEKPDGHVHRALMVANPSWSPAQTCIHAFEPNPKWTRTLHDMRKQLQHNVTSIEIHTETAVVHDDRTQVELFVDPSSLSESSSIAYGRKGGRTSTLVRGVNLHKWLVSRFAGSSTPIVMRIDVEGSEYNLLRSLIYRGTPALLERNVLHIAVEWHRYVKHDSLGVKETSWMRELDRNYSWIRGTNVMDTRDMLLEDTLEKQLHYWLAAAGVRLFF